MQLDRVDLGLWAVLMNRLFHILSGFFDQFQMSCMHEIREPEQ